MTAHVQRSSLRTLDPSGEAADRAASWFTADRPDPRSRHISCGLRLPSKNPLTRTSISTSGLMYKV
jgi:hypothetical protein